MTCGTCITGHGLPALCGGDATGRHEEEALDVSLDYSSFFVGSSPTLRTILKQVGVTMNIFYYLICLALASFVFIAVMQWWRDD